MYLDIAKSRSGSKVYTRILLRTSFRQDGKVKHRTIANLSSCSQKEIDAIRLALKHKDDLSKLSKSASASAAEAEADAPAPEVVLRQGLSVGAVALLYGLAGQIGILHALGNDRQAKLALWQVLSRVIDQGSRLSAVRLASAHACCDLLGLDSFNEDDLYENLAWLSASQPQIEARLFERLHPGAKPGLFLYDVTSSYLEGTCNAFAEFGYNRDGKRGKRQIVIGLLCDAEGVPLTIEVFAGNTSDPKTLGSQIQKVTKRFGGGAVTFVGDRGMIKGPQIEQLAKEGFHYISAISKPQIETLLKTGVIEMELFDHVLAEVCEERVRYILRRNPRRAAEMGASRQSKERRAEAKVEEANTYLAAHPRASLECALKRLRKETVKLKISAWAQPIQAVQGSRSIRLEIDAEARAEEAKLDGCYVLKTDLKPEQAAKELVHARYKDLTLVEQAFRTSKTVQLEMRPIHVRCAASTRGHALVVMLAYRLVQELARRWSSLDMTVEEGIQQLSSLCATELHVAGVACGQTIPAPRPEVARLIELAGVRIPQTLRSRGVKVATRKKLQKRRKKHSK